MSCDGTMIGSPFAGESTLFEASMSVRASICASSDSGTWPALWSPSEAGVEGGAHQRMELDRLALDQHRLEGLDAQAVQRRRAVEHHRVLADHLFQDVPDLGHFLLDQALGGLDSCR